MTIKRTASSGFLDQNPPSNQDPSVHGWGRLSDLSEQTDLIREPPRPHVAFGVPGSLPICCISPKHIEGSGMAVHRTGVEKNIYYPGTKKHQKANQRSTNG